MLMLWDSEAEVTESAEVVYRWNGYTERDGVYALLQYVETHAQRLKDKYLSFTHDLGEAKINGKRIIDALTLNNGLSYWWMTAFVEKDFHVLPLDDVIRLLALEEILSQLKPSRFVLVSANRCLHRILKQLCHGLGIDYEWRKQPKKNRRNNFNWSKAYFCQLLPQVIQAWLALMRHIRLGKRFKAITSPVWSDNNAMLMCGYYGNIDEEKASQGQFHSRYWEGLHGMIKELGIQANWFHQNGAHTSSTAFNWARAFNRDQITQGTHTFLESYLSWALILRVIKKWFFLQWTYWRFRGVGKLFCVQGTHLSLWPLLKTYWKNNLKGPASMTNLIVIELFEKALQSQPHQKFGLYLYENHPWECAFVHAWRKHGHGQLIAVAHTTVRFWDLRYFFDLKTWRSTQVASIPKPDLIALNGPAAVKNYIDAGYSEEMLVESEALRYEHLINCQSNMNVAKRHVNRILILGEIHTDVTDKMLCLLEKTEFCSQSTIHFSFKPHPLCSINVSKYTNLKLTVRSEPLKIILKEYDAVFAGPCTSSAVDAYFAGLPVVVIQDEEKLNYNPLRGQPNVYFVSDGETLYHWLHMFSHNGFLNGDVKMFFFLDITFGRWKKIMNQIFQTNTKVETGVSFEVV